MTPFLGSEKRALLSLLVVGVLLRLGLWLVVKAPQVYLVSEEYLELANQIRTLDFSGYTGFRTPVYPLILLLCGLNFTVVVLLQNLMGILLSILLFKLTWNRTQSSYLAFLVGVLASASLYRLYYEMVILTETLVTLLLATSLYGLFKIICCNKIVKRDYLIAGLCTALAAFAHPLVLFIGPLFFWAILHFQTKPSLAFKRNSALLFITPLFLLLFGWSCFNLAVTGHFTPTTLTGYHLTNHSGAFFEDAPDKYAVIRDIYLKYRDHFQRDYGTHSDAIYSAEPEIRRVTGWSQADLSARLTTISWGLFVKHPDLYGRSVWGSLKKFWRVQKVGHWAQITARFPFGVKLLEGFGYMVNTGFWALSFFLAWRFFRQRNNSSLERFDLLIVVVVLGGALIQAVMENCDNWRYAIPFHPLIWYVIIVAGWGFLQSLEQRQKRQKSDFNL